MRLNRLLDGARIKTVSSPYPFDFRNLLRPALHKIVLPLIFRCMRLKFRKMHGIGNDFVVLGASQPFSALSPEIVRKIADRRLGIGCDQVLVAADPELEGAHIAMKIFNADGTPAKQCGNGIRCFSKFVRQHGIVVADPIRVETAGGIVEATFLEDGEIRVNMGVPEFEPAVIPMRAGPRAKDYALRLAGEEFTIGAVSMGNPHAILMVEDAETAPVGVLGPKVQAHEWFSEGVNVGFMQVLSPERVRLRVFERGVGETPACGSGACAAVAVGVDQGILGNTVRVDLNGGSLKLEWAGEGASIWMTGPAADVFEGEIEL
jgi:diaminopimelate epimerase